MDNLFSGLESMGLSNLDKMDIFADKEANKREEKQKEKAVVVVDETDFLFDKTFKCPVCDIEFKEKVVKTGKARLVAQDSDLRPRYQDFDSLKYEVIACPVCGYAATIKSFDYMTSPQAKLIREKISSSFTGFGPEKAVYSYDDAIGRYKLAIVNAVIKRSKISERAYLCLKLAWLYRGKRETLTDTTVNYEATCNTLEKTELGLLQNAYDGFMEAFSKEPFPLQGLDENTATYLVAELAHKLGKNEESSRWISKILSSKTANERIKNKAREIKEQLLAEK